jgi:dolichol-phosphate mannosyltransferase
MLVSIIVPTYKEVLNLPELFNRLSDMANKVSFAVEALIMDDDSQDGTEDWIKEHGPAWAQLIVRKSDRGLSPAVLDGFRAAKGDVMVVMDADLSHPPEKIPELVAGAMAVGFALGSRYVPGAATNEKWSLYRRLNSLVATLMAYPLTSVKDPMSGFFAIRRDVFQGAAYLNPIGYKIGLELLVKCRCKEVVEVPIYFADRKFGSSKLTMHEQLKYIQHLRRLYIFKYSEASHLVQFMVVGASGVIVNLFVLTLLLMLGVLKNVAVAVAIFVSMVSNFALNRRFSFSYARGGSLIKQFFGFMLACLLGAIINYSVTLAASRNFPALPIQVAALAGIVSGMFANFFMSRFLVFSKKSNE